MSTRIYTVVFHEVDGRPVLTWNTKYGYVTKENLLEIHERYDCSLLKKERYKPPTSFFDSKGPQIARAARILGAKALVMDYESDRKVQYSLVFEEKPVGGSPSYAFTSVSAEAPSRTDVNVTAYLPTDERVRFDFVVPKEVHTEPPALESGANGRDPVDHCREDCIGRCPGCEPT